jgi:two-component system sporulation sensor kinase B
MVSFNALLVMLLCSIIFFAIFGLIKLFRIQLEQQTIAHSMESLTLGASIMNHTVKNEAQKIYYICGRVEDFMAENRKDNALALLDDLSEVTDHMKDMALRLMKGTKDFELEYSYFSLSDLIESVLIMIRPKLEQREIRIDIHLKKDITICADKLHLREAVMNICLNAIDAMKPGDGKLELSSARKGKQTFLYIKDNGKGIDRKYWDRIFELFFTTKKNTLHYGLGLSYSYMVVSKHGYELGILASEKDLGTTFYISIPNPKVK